LIRRRDIWLEQPMQMDDDIFHLGIIDGALGRASPSLLGIGIIVEKPDQIHLVEIDEVEALRVRDAAAEHEVKLAHGRRASIKSIACEPAMSLIS